MSLYPNYRPLRLPAKYVASAITILGEGQAADRLRELGVPSSYGDPKDAIAFFNDDGDGSCGAIVADYPNGRRAEWRRTANGSRLSIVRAGEAA